MATNPIPDVSPEGRPLTREEGLTLFKSMYGMLRSTYETLGGSEKFHREERESWDRDADHA